VKGVAELRHDLAVASARTVAEFEDAVRIDAGRHSGHDGTVHPLTSYVVRH
jgi:hypothetical protein